MSVYIVTFTDPNPRRGVPSTRTEEITAASDTDAKQKFLGLSWVAWTSITVDKVEPKTAEKIIAGEQLALVPIPDWRKRAKALSTQIGALSQQAIAAAKRGDHAAAKQSRLLARKLADERAALVKAGKKRGGK